MRNVEAVTLTLPCEHCGGTRVQVRYVTDAGTFDVTHCVTCDAPEA